MSDSPNESNRLHDKVTYNIVNLQNQGTVLTFHNKTKYGLYSHLNAAQVKSHLSLAKLTFPNKERQSHEINIV